MRIKATFRPQAWVNDWAVDVPIDQYNTWEMEVGELPEPWSYASDELRDDPAAPAWVKAWPGPFEVDYEVIEGAAAPAGEEA